MKRIGYLYENLISIENCKLAIINASKHKTKRPEVKKVLNDIDKYSLDLSFKIKNLEFNTQMGYRQYYDSSRKKTRDIYIPNFYPDQCAHHAIIQIIGPSIQKSSYLWSCANLPNKGLDHGCRKMTNIVKCHSNKCKYCLKMDVYHFYENVDHSILIKVLSRKFKDEKLIKTISYLLDNHLPGIPIGNYTSCWFAELLLQEIDYYILHSHLGNYYVRYADDMVICGNNKSNLHKLRKNVEKKLNLIGLKLKPNWQVFLVYNGRSGRKIDFMGRCFSKDYISVRKRRSLSMIRSARKIQKKNYKISHLLACSYMSKSSCILYGNTRGLKNKWYDSLDLAKIKNIIRNYSIKKTSN